MSDKHPGVLWRHPRGGVCLLNPKDRRHRRDLIRILVELDDTERVWRCNEFGLEFHVDPTDLTEGPFSMCGLPGHAEFGCGWHYIIPEHARGWHCAEWLRPESREWSPIPCTGPADADTKGHPDCHDANREEEADR